MSGFLHLPHIKILVFIRPECFHVFLAWGASVVARAMGYIIKQVVLPVVGINKGESIKKLINLLYI